MTITRGYELATDAQFLELSNTTRPPRAGRVTAIEASGQVRVECDDPEGGDVLAWPLNGFIYAVGDVVYVAFAVNAPDSALVIGSRAGIGTTTLDHGASLTGLGDDDHTQYALLLGRAGGQSLSGGNAANDDLTVQGTAHATRVSSYVFVQPTAGFVMIGSAVVPLQLLHVHRTTNAARNAFVITNDGTGNAQAGFRAALDPADDTTNYVAMDVFGSGRSTVGLIEALGTIIEGNGGGNMIISSYSAAKPMVFSTGNSRTGRMWILPTGEVSVGLSSVGASVLGIKAGTSTNDAAVGGTLFVSTTAVGNIGAGTDDLITYTVPANTLAVNGQSLYFEAWGTLANNANAKVVTLAWGADTYTLIAAAMDTSNTTWSVKGRIFRTGAATQKVFIDVMDSGDITGNQANIVSTGARTLSSSNVLKLTAVGVADNDIVCEAMIVSWDDNNT